MFAVPGHAGCPVAAAPPCPTPRGCPASRPTVSGVKVPGMQRCGKTPHGFLPPRLDWVAPPFVLKKVPHPRNHPNA